MVFVEPGKQLQGLNDLLNLENPPSYLDMASVTLAKENQMPAAKMLEKAGIKPQIETGHIAASAWADWTLTLEPEKFATIYWIKYAEKSEALPRTRRKN